MYEERSPSPPANDTIVVEQWTVIEVSEGFWPCTCMHTHSLILQKATGRAGLDQGSCESTGPADPAAANSDVSSQSANMKTDYGPLLHTLAEFGWLLTCVLPTPIMRHDR